MDKITYIKELKKNLKGLPMEQREDMLREIEQHIADAIAAGKEESFVIARLGNPEILAKSLAGEYYAENNNILKAIPFFVSAGIGSFFMVFLFGGMALLFSAGAVGSIVGGIMRTLGSERVNMTMFNMEVPRILSIPTGLLTAAFLFVLVYLCCRTLKRYFIRVANAWKE
ncbi:DUF1700 domain-containing protein [Sinanaerobacter sp. ZZT-01]|uniref:DUF1700 domain-containing protein n=1 Tax=Sinanaerobacter sp. ZZT-01 TaxID=3111540 RepID=UPI002D79239E|nr:DUF1700 domain-containing protein [Sinanaerobacter sp. ZZT-01]WRR93685.1 DUF1700 domain-containing protein [Sinanaerobacter sp. ZZT-01]